MARKSIPKRTIDAEAMKRRAAAIFVDREEPKAIYTKAIERLHAHDKVHFLSFYGVGGQGKSALFKARFPSRAK